MFPLLEIASLSKDAVIAATRCMLKIAQVDGIHPAEETLIQGFYSSFTTDGSWPAYSALTQNADYHVEAVLFNSAQERELLLALCIMTAFADGSFTAAEQAVVKEIASDIQLSEAQFDAVNSQVKDYMLSQLSHLPDAASVAKVAAELG